jgi:hypothetical protein
VQHKVFCVCKGYVVHIIHGSKCVCAKYRRDTEVCKGYVVHIIHGSKCVCAKYRRDTRVCNTRFFVCAKDVGTTMDSNGDNMREIKC